MRNEGLLFVVLSRQQSSLLLVTTTSLVSALLLGGLRDLLVVSDSYDERSRERIRSNTMEHIGNLCHYIHKLSTDIETHLGSCLV
jgi:hypothetical protein